MKDVALRSPVTLAVAAGATSPAPPTGERPIIWSTTESEFLYWDGAAWTALSSGTGGTQTVASEALNAGDLVNLWSDGGTAKMRKAGATSGKYADGFVLAGVASAATGTMFFSGENSLLSGLTVGPVFLSTTAGGVTSTPPGTGNIVQRVGFALSATKILFQRETPIQT